MSIEYIYIYMRANCIWNGIDQAWETKTTERSAAGKASNRGYYSLKGDPLRVGRIKASKKGKGNNFWVF